MGCLIRASQNVIRLRSSHSPSSSPTIQLYSFLHHSTLPLLSPKPTSTRTGISESLPRSPIDANIVRILRNEIQYQPGYAPIHEPATKFKSFTVQDRPGEQWITMRGKFGDDEEVKIEVTMFDGYELCPKHDGDGEDVILRLSVLVGISKGDSSDDLEFVCSAWPDNFEVRHVYSLPRDRKLARLPYLGPDIRGLNKNFQKTFRNYLGARGIDDELSFFLHDYMMNKDRIELVQWLTTVKSYVEK
ncbi:uncharacterized protein At2g39795, mitochondrial [Humulus lupulus]|uniref:uncharacterized protein At2g39795, mitochondrial n=1 Tax=Humulus lupulus TaxID=3486 RepID=UPI002B40EAC4|nr:uncharacterized protein At2g39795, mitochondrial [Humulus lupulus]